MVRVLGLFEIVRHNDCCVSTCSGEVVGFECTNSNVEKCELGSFL